MEKKNEGNVFNKLTSLFTRYPGATVSVLTLFAFGVIGLIIYLAPQFGNAQNTNTTTNSLKFDLPSESPQSQGAVEGANTQAQSEGPQEQTVDAPSPNSVSDTPKASDSATPTETPVPTSSPTSAPTATPEPTSVPTQTPTSTPTPTIVPKDTSSPSPSE